jgi:hypothetical protein
LQAHDNKTTSMERRIRDDLQAQDKRTTSMELAQDRKITSMELRHDREIQAGSLTVCSYRGDIENEHSTDVESTMHRNRDHVKCS